VSWVYGRLRHTIQRQFSDLGLQPLHLLTKVCVLLLQLMALGLKFAVNESSDFLS
jgi:hypothetical protein